MESRKLFESARNMCKMIEEHFVTLGEMLLQIRDEKVYRANGYETFREFAENELTISGARANLLVKIYETMIKGMDMYDGDVQAIGYDKVAMIVPMIKKAASPEEAREWVDKADTLSLKELRKAVKEAKPKKEKDFKKVFAEQATERLCEFLSCKKSMLIYNLAFYFQDTDMDDVASTIFKKRKAFEAEVMGLE